ncbi:hypothetical protein CCAX7_11040 [Capsulimonas corticalis]|uniref:Uncharacterized protein n=1 Tax=Capsulimonas corticalis TaxID=2219043 RepID=A0A402CUM3_9BACT|nr:right-handed parallel beta-helix repeat-containing protein [Capsulimonas corticalis]BDI29053.1 hypothetical protein CCAX7_11040 [Capsulimonas corticalis]
MQRCDDITETGGRPGADSEKNRIKSYRRAIAVAAMFMPMALGPSPALARYDPRSYNPSAPTFLVTYTARQKAEQRVPGAAMMAELESAAKSGQASYTIKPGVYRITGGLCALDGVRHFILHCRNVHIWMENNPAAPSLRWITLRNCQDITVDGPVFLDSEQLQFIQGVITGVDAVNKTIDIQVTPGYEAKDFPAQTQGNLSWHYNRKGECLTRPVYTSYVNLDPGDITKKRLTIKPEYFDGPAKRLKVGDLFLTHNTIDGDNTPFGVERDTRDLDLEGVQCYYGPMWATVASSGKFINRNCSNYREPGTNRLGGCAEPPNLDNADELVYDGCNCGPGQDDGVNITRRYSLTADQTGPRTLILAVRPAPGESIDFYDGDSYAPEGTALVAAEPTPLADDARRTRLIRDINAIQDAHGYAWRLQPGDLLWSVPLDRDVKIARFSAVDRSGDRIKKATIRNCYFADMNAQAFFLKASSILMENNVVERGTGPAYHAQLSPYWWEGPMPQNVTIRNNVSIDNPSRYGNDRLFWDWAIGSICVEVGGNMSGVGDISPVTIEGNRIVRSTVTPIVVKNAKNVVIRNNQITAPMPAAPKEARIYGAVPAGAIYLAADSNVQVYGNHLLDATPFCATLVELGPFLAPGAVTGGDIKH